MTKKLKTAGKTAKYINGALPFGAVLTIAMLFAAASAFAQESTDNEMMYGLEVGYGVISGVEFLSNYSVSFQSWPGNRIYELVDLGASLDWIQGVHSNGLLLSIFGGFPLGSVFKPYVGGGIGVELLTPVGFAWKLDAGAMIAVSNAISIHGGITYDNIREGLSITVGVGVKPMKNVTATYRGANKSTFQRTYTKLRWEDNSTPDSIYVDEFEDVEVLRQYQKTTTKSYYTPPSYDLKTSGGEISKTTLKDEYGKTIATASTSTPKKTEWVKTKDSKTETVYYVYNVTVSRMWYKRTHYYKDRAPTSEMLYKDGESAVLIRTYEE